MYPTILDDDHQILIPRNGIPTELKYIEFPGATSYHIGSRHADLIFQQISDNPYPAWLSHYIIQNPTRITGVTNEGCYFIHFALEGTYEYWQRGIASRTFSPSHFNIFYFSEFDYQMIFDKDVTCSTLNIGVPLELLESLKRKYSAIEDFVEASSKHRFISFLPGDIPYSRHLHHIIERLLKSSLPDELNLEYAANTIKTLAIESLKEAAEYRVKLLSEDIIIERIDALLTESIHSQHPSKLSSLAAELNTTVKQLERKYTAANGRTIYGQFKRLQMREIAYLLKSTNLSGKEISTQFGYSDYSSFSAAFKRFFGVSPRDYRNS